MASTANARLIYLTGHGHSGSTLLDLLLSNHPQVASAGEAMYLSVYGGSTQPRQGCACGQPVAECEFWSEVARRLSSQEAGRVMDFWRRFSTSQQVSPSLWNNRFHFLKLSLILGGAVFRGLARFSGYLRQFEASARNSWQVLDTIAQLENKPCVVDASKDPVRLKLLHLVRPESVWAIHLVRDGRGLAASEKTRENWPVEVSVRSWRRRYRDVRLLTRFLPSNRGYFLRYEDLCADPERVLRQLCDFLGLEFDPAMLRLERAGHGIGGSQVRFDASRRATVQVDERWKQILSGEELRTFGRVGGRLNARLGYG